MMKVIRRFFDHILHSLYTTSFQRSGIFLLLLFSLAHNIMNPLYAQWVKVDGSHGGITNSLGFYQSNLLAGTSNGIFRSSDNGNNWSEYGSGITDQVMCITQVGSTLLAGTSFSGSSVSKGGVYRSIDGGRHWIEIISGLSGSAVHGFAVVPNVDGNYLVFVATESGVLKSSDEGVNWIEVDLNTPTSSIVAEQLSGGNINLYAGISAIGSESSIYFSSDFGNSWEPRSSGLPKIRDLYYRPVYSIAVTDSGLFAGTYGVYRSTDHGMTWNNTNVYVQGIDNSVFSIVCNGSTILATDGMLIYRSTDAGGNWNTFGYGLPQTYFRSKSIFNLISSGNIFYAGTTAGVFKSEDDGFNWRAASEGLDVSAPNAITTSGQHVFVSSSSGYYLTHSSDNGDHWTPITGDTVYYKYYYLTANNSILAATLDYPRSPNLLLRYSIQDNSWNSTMFSPMTPAGPAQAINESYLYLVGSSSSGAGVLRFPLNSPDGSFFNSGLPNANIKILASDGSNIFAAINGHGVYKSTDNGENWSAANTGLDSLQIINTIGAKESIVFLGTTISYNLGIFSKGIYRSGNSGKNWTLVTGSITDSVITGIVRYGNIVLAGTGDDGVYLSVNNGDNWVPYNDGLPNTNVLSLALNDGYVYLGIKGGIWRRSLSDITSVNQVTDQLPEKFTLYQNFPNPFNPTTTVKFSIPKSSYVTLKFYDVLGREVKTLVSEEKPVGNYEIKFDGSLFASGIYFYRLQAGEFLQTKKLILLK